MPRSRMPHELHVVSTENVTPHLTRVWFTGPGFDAIAARTETDAYVKLVFLADGFDYPQPLDLGVVQETLPPEAQPTLRTYTIQQVDDENRRFAIDFVVHGDEGIAGPWAASAQPGDRLPMMGPGGGYSPSADADFHFLVGDETALPAISAALQAMPSGARGVVYAETGDVADEVELPLPDGFEVHYVRRTGEDHSALRDAVVSAPWPDGAVHVFAHGEAELTMRGLRPYFRGERNVPAALASISGYWRHGRTEEAFRTWKRDLAEQDAKSA
ncbi:siderophore-interacting protein [Flexivirga caeni]|uniref:Siderophore-interacting protein n=1 Tax=Flexivirga caeni TaxID=2294115 RepID=A0A3M9MC25_9MICO|nr:siderophore-interacting protein [Flexivirga caeni]RNI23074.1 siderophore-interacting protein [Flexivirga caeni]